MALRLTPLMNEAHNDALVAIANKIRQIVKSNLDLKIKTYRDALVRQRVQPRNARLI